MYSKCKANLNKGTKSRSMVKNAAKPVKEVIASQFLFTYEIKSILTLEENICLNIIIHNKSSIISYYTNQMY